MELLHAKQKLSAVSDLESVQSVSILKLGQRETLQ